MLTYHLSQETELASWPIEKIDHITSWIDDQLCLDGKKICDLGCGPGLYTSRFHARGAEVIGLDISVSSISYAREQATHAGFDIQYQQANYLEADFPHENDLVTLIYGDYCVLSPSQRKHLLSKIHASMKTDGALIFDVFTHNQFSERTEDFILESDLMDGFWAPEPYVGFQRNWLYRDLYLTLDHYLIVTRENSFEVYNWLQHFSPESLRRELMEAGFSDVSLFSAIDGAELIENQLPRNGEIFTIARKKSIA